MEEQYPYMYTRLEAGSCFDSSIAKNVIRNVYPSRLYKAAIDFADVPPRSC
jgi:hypothetical protein